MSLVRWLRLHAPKASGTCPIPSQGTVARMAQLRLKIPHATIKTWSSQINKYYKPTSRKTFGCPHPEASKGEATCKFCAFRDFCVRLKAIIPEASTGAASCQIRAIRVLTSKLVLLSEAEASAVATDAFIPRRRHRTAQLFFSTTNLTNTTNKSALSLQAPLVQ